MYIYVFSAVVCRLVGMIEQSEDAHSMLYINEGYADSLLLGKWPSFTRSAEY